MCIYRVHSAGRPQQRSQNKHAISSLINAKLTVLSGFSEPTPAQTANKSETPVVPQAQHDLRSQKMRYILIECKNLFEIWILSFSAFAKQTEFGNELPNHYLK